MTSFVLRSRSVTAALTLSDEIMAADRGRHGISLFDGFQSSVVLCDRSCPRWRLGAVSGASAARARFVIAVKNSADCDEEPVGGHALSAHCRPSVLGGADDRADRDLRSRKMSARA